MDELELLQELYDRYEEDGDTDRRSLIEHITERYNSDSFDRSDIYDNLNRKWKDKYDDLSKRYKKRFFYGEKDDIDDTNKVIDDIDDSNKVIEDKKITIDDLFERRK